MIDKANVGGTVHDINDTGARGMISPDVFSTAAAYEAGEYCIYNNTLYKFTEAKSAGAWDDSKASATDIASELSALNSSLTPVEIDIDTTIDGIHAYRMGKMVFVFMENINRPAWSEGYIATGLPNPVNNFTAVGYNGNPFSFGDSGIYSDGTTTSGWDSFATTYITAE